MKRKVIVGVVLLVASGYVLDLAFHGMNKADDLFYVGGILGAAIWLVVLVPLLWKFLTKERKENAKPVKAAGTGDSVSN